MKQILFSIALAFVSSTAFAQESTPLTTEQILGIQIGNMSIQNAKMTVMIDKENAQIRDLQKEITDLKAKYEPVDSGNK